MSDKTACRREGDAVPRYWFAGDVFETRFLEAMSLLAPEVERFVIQAVRAAVPGIADETRVRECMDFVREELGHSRAHHAFNRRLVAQGIDGAAALAPVRRISDLAGRRLDARGRLAAAAACEHLAALVSLSYLRARSGNAILSDRTSRLFEYHARDELRHRDFVFDVQKDAGGGRWLARVLALLAVTGTALWCAARAADELLKFDAPSGRMALWRRGVTRLLQRRNWVLVGPLLRGWLAYFRPGFHPSELPDG
jgi:hypothetical protein